MSCLYIVRATEATGECEKETSKCVLSCPVDGRGGVASWVVLAKQLARASFTDKCFVEQENDKKNRQILLLLLYIYVQVWSSTLKVDKFIG